MVSLASRKREGTGNNPEKIDSRVALYLPRSERVALELVAEARGVGLNKLLRELIRRGQQAVAAEGRNNE